MKGVEIICACVDNNDLGTAKKFLCSSSKVCPVFLQHLDMTRWLESINSTTCGSELADTVGGVKRWGQPGQRKGAPCLGVWLWVMGWGHL